MKHKRKMLRRCAAVAVGVLVIAWVAFLVYFPGRQSLLAMTLASGIGITSMQARVDALEDKAIKGKPFADADKAFLRDLYTCFAKGARLTFVLRQSAQLMDRYLSGSGEPLRLEPRIFLGSTNVQKQMTAIVGRVTDALHAQKGVEAEYTSPTFYMGDPEFFESFVGLYFGRLIAHPRVQNDGTVLLQWRAEMPWQWPSYESLYKQYGNPHAQCFPLPNMRSLLLGPRYCLRMDDGLGEHLAQIGLAKPFLVFSEWEEQMVVIHTTTIQSSQP